MVETQPDCFVPNQGQWEDESRYVAKFGAMTMFLQETGWTFTLVERKGAMPCGPGDHCEESPCGCFCAWRGCEHDVPGRWR